VDVLFRSVAETYGGHVLSAIMTGMGSDGANGVKALKAKGAYCLTQSATTCVVYGMPRAVDEARLSDESIPLEQLGNRMATLIQSKPVTGRRA
jgi:two-component system chemotaxis response regulator CheB